MEKQSVFVKGVLSGVGALIAIVIVVGVVAAYRAPDATPVFPAVLAVVRAPAALVGGSVITWHDVSVDMTALKKFLAGPAGADVGAKMSDDVLRTTVLRRLMTTAIAEDLADEKGVRVTTEQLDAEFALLAAAGGGAEKVKDDILKNFGWTYEEYRDRVIRAMVLMRELDRATRDVEGVRSRATAVLERVRGGKEDFSAVAREVGEDSSAPDGGDLGFMQRGETVPEFEAALFALKKGEVGGVVETEFGMHIIKVEELSKNKKGVVDAVRARHILIKFKPVTDVLDERLRSASVWQFMYTEKPAREPQEGPQVS